jgi:hypothetical protein
MQQLMTGAQGVMARKIRGLCERSLVRRTLFRKSCGLAGRWQRRAGSRNEFGPAFGARKKMLNYMEISPG